MRTANLIVGELYSDTETVCGFSCLMRCLEPGSRGIEYNPIKMEYVAGHNDYACELDLETGSDTKIICFAAGTPFFEVILETKISEWIEKFNNSPKFSS